MHNIGPSKDAVNKTVDGDLPLPPGSSRLRGLYETYLQHLQTAHERMIPLLNGEEAKFLKLIKPAAYEEFVSRLEALDPSKRSEFERLLNLPFDAVAGPESHDAAASIDELLLNMPPIPNMPGGG